MVEQNQGPRGSLKPPRRRWLRTAILGCVILICGALIGSGLTFRFLWGAMMSNIGKPEKMTQRIVKRIDRRLDLGDEQRQKVEKIVARRMKVLRALRLEVQPRMEEELKNMQLEIRDLLIPKQVLQWDKDVQKFRKRWFVSENKGG